MTINTARSQASVKEPTAVYVGALGLAAILAGCCLAYAVLLRYGMTGWEEAFGTSSYRGAAERWIETGTSTNNRPPAYPTLLAVNAWLWGVSAYVPAVVVIQALTAWGTLMALFLLARRSTGSAAWGLIAVTVVCLNLLWVHEAVRNREAFLYSALLVALVGAMVHLRPQSVLYGVAVGGCCAIGWLTRPPGIVSTAGRVVLYLEGLAPNRFQARRTRGSCLDRQLQSSGAHVGRAADGRPAGGDFRPLECLESPEGQQPGIDGDLSVHRRRPA